MDTDNRWTQGFNCGVVAVAAHLRMKADLFQQCGEEDKAKAYYQMSAVALEKMKPTGVKMTTVPTPAGPVPVSEGD